jgi:hypothetical protein
VDDLAVRWFARILLIVSAGLFVAGYEVWGVVAAVVSVLWLVIGRVVAVRREVRRTAKADRPQGECVSRGAGGDRTSGPVLESTDSGVALREIRSQAREAIARAGR